MPYGRLAETEPSAYKQDSQITLNPQYWQSNPSTLTEADNGFRVSGTSNPEGVITHEFGHAVESALDWKQSASPYTSDQQMQIEVPPALSIYGRSNEQEKFAETFAAAMTPSSSQWSSPQAASMRTMLKDTGIWKGAK
jgi:hypothetical protein